MLFVYEYYYCHPLKMSVLISLLQRLLTEDIERLPNLKTLKIVGVRVPGLGAGAGAGEFSTSALEEKYKTRKQAVEHL